MQGEPGYEECWAIAAEATCIRPATLSEVADWLNTHEWDARYADACQVEGATMKVVKTSDGYSFE